MNLNNFYGDIVTLVTTRGDIVGRLLATDTQSVTLKNPRLFIHAQDQMGFLPSISITCEHDVEEGIFFISNILSIMKTHNEIVRSWQQITSGIVLA